MTFENLKNIYKASVKRMYAMGSDELGNSEWCDLITTIWISRWLLINHHEY